MRGNRLVVNDNDPPSHLFVRHKSQRRQSVSSTRTRKALVQPVARSHSLKQAAPNEIGFSQFPSSNQMCHRVNMNTHAPINSNALGDIDRLPGRRSQSFRNEDRPCFLKPNSTRLDIRSSQLSQMQVTVDENGDLIRRKSSFSNPRRQIRAASIDVSSPMKPVFTIGGCCIIHFLFSRRLSAVDYDNLTSMDPTLFWTLVFLPFVFRMDSLLE